MGNYSRFNPQKIDVSTIENLTLADYGWTVDAIKAYMFGVSIVNPETGQEMGDNFYKHILEVSIGKAEKALDVAILPRLISREAHDFYDSDWQSYMFTHTFKRPILQVEDVRIEFVSNRSYSMPSNWWRVYNLAGDIEIFPTPLLQATGGQGFYDYNNLQSVSALPMIGGSSTYAPQIINLDYVAGMLPRKRAGISEDWELPPDLEQLVIKYALKEIFQVWGRLIIGAGIASRRLEVDGISESIETTQSAMFTGSAADIKLIDQDIADLTSKLKSYYGQTLGII